MNYPPTDHEVREVQEILVLWGKSNFREFPWRCPEQPWHGLVAEILLQRTRAGNVIPVYRRFINRFPTLQEFARASEAEIEEIIYPLGLRWRVPLLAALGRRLYDSGGLPDTVDELIDLPGVGPYVAAAWMSLHAGLRGVLVDANTVRWMCRLVGREYDGETRRKKWLIYLADRLTPYQGARTYNYALLDFTMTICGPGEPRCSICPIGPRLCEYGRQKLGQQ